VSEARSIESDRARDAAAESTWESWRRALGSARREAWGDPWGYAFIAPALVLFVVFGAWPVLRGLSMAFTDYRFLLADHAPFVGLQNFVEMSGDEEYTAGLGRSLLFSAIYAPANVLVSLFLATFIAQVRHARAASVYRVLVYLPVVLPISVAMLLWKELGDSQFGYVNYFLHDVLGLGIKPAWFSDPPLVIPTMAVAAIWKTLGANTLLFLIGLYNINAEIYEAASMDGAGPFQQWRWITVPLIKPTLTLVLVLITGVLSWAGTQEALILFNGGGPQEAGQTVGVYSYLVAFRVGDLRWGYAAAMNLSVGILAMIVAAIVFRTLRSERPT
jgi:ABC-type sugar transport system permease subunit